MNSCAHGPTIVHLVRRAKIRSELSITVLEKKKESPKTFNKKVA